MTYPSFPGRPEVNAGFFYAAPGLHHSPEYMVSGLPFSQQVSASTDVTRVNFPMVTSELYIKNRAGGPVHIGWTENGVQGTAKHTLLTNEAVTFRLRVKSIFFVMDSGSGEVDLTAALTQIRKREYPEISASYADPDTGYFGYNTASLDRAWGWDPGVG